MLMQIHPVVAEVPCLRALFATAGPFLLSRHGRLGSHPSCVCTAPFSPSCLQSHQRSFPSILYPHFILFSTACKSRAGEPRQCRSSVPAKRPHVYKHTPS